MLKSCPKKIHIQRDHVKYYILLLISLELSPTYLKNRVTPLAFFFPSFSAISNMATRRGFMLPGFFTVSSMAATTLSSTAGFSASGFSKISLSQSFSYSIKL